MQLSYDHLGVYFAHSASALLRIPIASYEATRDRYVEIIDGPDNASRGWILRKDIPFTLAEITPLLTRDHERQHYVQLMSSPIGLLIWRTLNSLLTATQWLISTSSRSTAAVHAGAPLVNWYKSKGRDALLQDPPSPPTNWKSEILDSARARHYRETIIADLDRVIDEIDTLSSFLEAIIGRPKISIGQFIEIANKAYRYIAISSDLKKTTLWTTNLDPNLPLLPEGYFSLTELLEAQSRLWERGILENAKANADLLQQWEDNCLHGVYGPAYKFVMNSLGDVTFSTIAIDVSLQTPIDLACLATRSSELRVEDVLPSWRIPKVVKALCADFWDSKTAKYRVLEGIAKHAKIPTPKEGLEIAANVALSGPMSWGADSKLTMGEYFGFANFFQHAQEEFKRAFNARLNNPLVFLGVGQLSGPPFRPVVEVYSDYVNFDPIKRGSGVDETQLGLEYYLHLAASLGLLAILSEGDPGPLKSLETSAFAYFKDFLNSESDWGNSSANPRVIASRALGNYWGKLLNW